MLPNRLFCFLKLLLQGKLWLQFDWSKLTQIWILITKSRIGYFRLSDCEIPTLPSAPMQNWMSGRDHFTVITKCTSSWFCMEHCKWFSIDAPSHSEAYSLFGAQLNVRSSDREGGTSLPEFGPRFLWSQAQCSTTELSIAILFGYTWSSLSSRKSSQQW